MHKNNGGSGLPRTWHLAIATAMVIALALASGPGISAQGEQVHRVIAPAGLLDAGMIGPTLLTPADGAIDVSFKPTFSWTAVAQADNYLLEVATDAGFINIVYTASETGTSHTAAVPLSANTTYYWRVTASNVYSAGTSVTFSFTTQAATMVCNGPAVDFEDGIPADWTVVSNSPGGIVWVTTADPACEIGNLTNGTGEAACADSDAAGYPSVPYDTELVSNPLDFSAVGAAVLDVKAYYRDITLGSNDRFEVDVWDGSAWTNELTWDEDHRPEDFSLNLSAYAGEPVVQVRFRYSGDGYDWYAQVDDIALTCVSPSPPVIEVDPASLTAWQWPDVVSTQPMTVTNSGGSPLIWDIVEDDTACDSPSDIPWLSVSPIAGTTFPLDSTVVDVSFDSAGMAPGDYSANLCVDSDDTATGIVQVPVYLTVEPPEALVCNGAMIEFEDGIPASWAVIDNTGGTGIVWVTTADPACGQDNQTNGTGEAACADSDAAGTPATPYDTELWTPPIDLSGQGAVVLDVKAYYKDIESGSDRFEVDVWDGVGWINELSWDEDHTPEDFSLNLSAYAGEPVVQVRFRYSGNGYDWYAQVDDIALTCAPVGPPVVEVDPASLTARQGSDVVSTQPMTITNSGGSPLIWDIVEDDTACDSPIDIPWLSVSPIAGTTFPLDSTVVDVSFDSAGMAPGDYSANLCVRSDDPVTPLVVVPVNMTVSNEPPAGAAVPGSQSPQYSDEIAPITVTATDNIAAVLTAETSWISDGGTFKTGLPDFLMLSTTPSCVDIGGGMQSCTWTISGAIDLPEGAYTVRTAVSDGYGGVTDIDAVIEVIPEDATVAFDNDNPISVPVAVDGGYSSPFSLTVHLTEKQPDLPADGDSGVAPGDISRANVTMILVPVGPGGPMSPVSCATSVAPDGYAGEMTVVCDFTDVSVNTYTVQVVVDGGYYTGYSEDVLVVFDPSLGFATGGGWFYWPGTTDKTTFGFTMKYKKDGSNVKGNLLLIRHTSDGDIYRVKSNALYGLALGTDPSIPMGWASFSGKCTYLEPGWPEPIGSYEFIIYVEDRGEPGTGVDRVWVQVLDKDEEIVAVMTMLRPATDYAEVLGGGNVAVPH